MIIEQRSGDRLERWDLATFTYESWKGDVLTESRPFTDAEMAQVVVRQQDVEWQNRRADAGRLLRLSFATNRNYLDKVDAGTATNADHIAQVPRLTREMQGIIRLVVATSWAEDVDFESPSPTGT